MRCRLLFEAVLAAQQDAAALLLRRGADPNLTQPDGVNPLVPLTLRQNRGMEDDSRLEFMKLLLDHGSDPNTRYDYAMVRGLTRRFAHPVEVSNPHARTATGTRTFITTKVRAR